MIKALLFAAALAAAAPVSDVQSLVATEAAFASAASKTGIASAFRRYATSGGIVFAGGKPVKVSEAYADGKPVPKALVWRSQAAGVARSGDLGFDIGPYTHTAKNDAQVHGWFATVWAKQADGAWRFLVDTGIYSGDWRSAVPETPSAVIQPGLAGDAATAFNDVQAAELRLTPEGFGTARSLAADAWVLRDGSEAATGKAAIALAKKDKRTFYTPLGGGSSADGDMAYFYGRAETAKTKATYLHIWQRRPGGWTIVIDAVTSA